MQGLPSSFCFPFLYFSGQFPQTPSSGSGKPVCFAMMDFKKVFALFFKIKETFKGFFIYNEIVYPKAFIFVKKPSFKN